MQRQKKKKGARKHILTKGMTMESSQHPLSLYLLFKKLFFNLKQILSIIKSTLSQELSGFKHFYITLQVLS